MSAQLKVNSKQVTDEDAMWQVQANDDLLAFTGLVQRWEKPIQRLCARVTGDAHLAEDLCQEAFTRVFIKRKLYRPRSKFSTWIWRVALNLCYSKLRNTQSRLDRHVQSTDDSALGAAEIVSDQPTPQQHLMRVEQTKLIQNALSSLPESLRSILTMRYCEGMKLREVAERLRIPETTAASRCAVALARITKILGSDFEH